MIQVTVQRAPANKPGNDIVSPFMTSENIAVARGTQEINRACSNRVSVTGALPIRAAIMPGAVIEITDLETGKYRAMVKRFAITIDRREEALTATANLQVERVE